MKNHKDHVNHEDKTVIIALLLSRILALRETSLRQSRVVSESDYGRVDYV
ncbi:hypothetical protein PBNK5_35840 [Pectobacterium brasiliense]